MATTKQTNRNQQICRGTTIARGMATTQQHQDDIWCLIWYHFGAIKPYVGAMLVHFGAVVGVTLVNLVIILSHVDDIIVSVMASSSTCSSNIKNKYMLETIKSLSCCSCRAIIQHLETSMPSNIEFTQPMEVHKSLSLCPCRARTQSLEISMPSNIEFIQPMEVHKYRSLGPCRARTQSLERSIPSNIEFI